MGLHTEVAPSRGGAWIETPRNLPAEPETVRLQSSYPEYRQYTWHTNRDTFDKVVFDDLKNNATLAAMLAYLAAEDPDRVPNDKRAMPNDERTGRPIEWPGCPTVRRSPPN